jgi:hypothetical protein
MAYSNRNLRAALIALYPTAPTNDLTTLFVRHIGNQLVVAGDTPLSQGKDIQQPVTTFLNALADAP